MKERIRPMLNKTQKYVPSDRPAYRVGRGQGHHFFGYYNKSNWGPGDGRVLSHRVGMMAADLTPSMQAEIGYFDVDDGEEFHVLGQTAAWNWQMGAQLQWLGGAARIIYNVRTDHSDGLYPGYGSVVHDLDSGVSRQLGTPVYVVSPDGRYALTVDYSRLHITHPTIGYCPAGRAPTVSLCPGDDGIHHIDLETGATRLLVSYAGLKAFDHRPSMDKAIHWVSHIEINPSSTRFLFLHRWTERVEDETCFLHRLITMNLDGGDMRLLECSDHPLPQLADNFDPAAVGTFEYEKSEHQISHPLWRDDEHIIVWGPHDGEIHYHLYRDGAPADVEIVGRDVLTENGHMTYSPIDRRWLLTDTYPDAATNERALLLYDVERGACHRLGMFYTDPRLSKENRCDLHPRWSRDGTRICIDSVHENERQMYIVDVSSIVASS